MSDPKGPEMKTEDTKKALNDYTVLAADEKGYEVLKWIPPRVTREGIGNTRGPIMDAYMTLYRDVSLGRFAIGRVEVEGNREAAIEEAQKTYGRNFELVGITRATRLAWGSRIENQSDGHGKWVRDLNGHPLIEIPCNVQQTNNPTSRNGAAMKLFTTLFKNDNGNLHTGTVEAENKEDAARKAVETFRVAGQAGHNFTLLAVAPQSTRKDGHGCLLWKVAVPSPIKLGPTLKIEDI